MTKITLTIKVTICIKLICYTNFKFKMPFVLQYFLDYDTKSSLIKNSEASDH